MKSDTPHPLPSPSSGRNDPVLSMPYVREFAGFLRRRTEATVSEVVFPKARHSMAIVDEPETYKSAHIEHLLASVPEWRVAPVEGPSVELKRPGK